MKTRRLLLTTVLFTGASLLATPLPAAKKSSGKPARVLMVTQSKGYVHGSVNRRGQKLAPAEIAMTKLGKQTGLFTVDCTQDCAKDFTVQNLKQHDIVAFYTTGELPISKAARDYFLNVWLKQKGHGFIGFHSAADTYRSAPNNKSQNERYRWYWNMLGGTFNGHPWSHRTSVAISVQDTKHPASRPFGKEFRITDEIYQYRNWQPKKVHLLMSIDMAHTNPKKPYHVPVAWVKTWGQGRIFFTNLGHNPATWKNAKFLESIEGAVKWIRGQEPGDATPNPEISAAQEAKARKDAAQ